MVPWVLLERIYCVLIPKAGPSPADYRLLMLINAPLLCLCLVPTGYTPSPRCLIDIQERVPSRHAMIGMNEIMLYDSVGAYIPVAKLRPWISSEQDKQLIVGRCFDKIIDEATIGCATDASDFYPRVTVAYDCSTGSSDVSKVEIYVRVFGGVDNLEDLTPYKVDFLSSNGTVEKTQALKGVRQIYTVPGPGVCDGWGLRQGSCW